MLMEVLSAIPTAMLHTRERLCISIAIPRPLAAALRRVCSLPLEAVLCVASEIMPTMPTISVVVSIDYRLGLRNLDAGADMGIRDMIVAMQRSVDIAVEDIYAATLYILDNAASWGVDTSKIMLSGSSAGAIAVLQAEWGRCNRSSMAAVLPSDFGYAAVVACAGAIFSTSGAPHWSSAPAPTMLFHGTSDRNVPYRKASVMGIGFYGSEYIARELDKLSSPYYFYSVQYADHSVAVTPLIDQIDLILQFIDDYVIDGRRLCVTTDVVRPDCAKSPTRFSVKEYLEANYSPR